jgi:hypothetical protein
MEERTCRAFIFTQTIGAAPSSPAIWVPPDRNEIEREIIVVGLNGE